MTDSFRLSDRDMELIVRRITAEINRQRMVARRWRLGLVATVIAALLATLASIYTEMISLGSAVQMLDRGVGDVAERVDVVEARPYIEDVATPPGEPGRLLIRGSAFGDRPGLVELFYKRIIAEVFADEVPAGPATTRSPTVILSGDRVVSWTDEQITTEISAEQRRVILDGLAAQEFRDLQPFVRVVTASGRRSFQW